MELSEKEEERSDDSSSLSGDETYTGERNKVGEPDGEGTLESSDGCKFTGRFAAGKKHGRGTLHFPDGSRLECTWADDECEGEGQYISADGDITQGHFTDGVPTGPVRETTAEGALIFDGHYEEGIRHGPGTLYFGDGGSITGTFVEGVLDGDAAYTYPDGSQLVGEWRNGDMWKAHYLDQAAAAAAKAAQDAAAMAASEAKGRKAAAPSARHLRSRTVFSQASGPARATRRAAARRSSSSPPPQEKDGEEAVFTYDPPVGKIIARRPLLPDPYETPRVYAAPSPIPGANEGLFARRDIQPHEVVAFYNGVKIPEMQANRRPWRFNGNCIWLYGEGDEGVMIDVPLEYVPTSAYCATLAHKANHSFTPNAEYCRFMHPRFGDIKGIRALDKVIPAGTEITVLYGYSRGEGPQWYRALAKSLGLTELLKSKRRRWAMEVVARPDEEQQASEDEGAGEKADEGDDSARIAKN
ncbi:putative histone-lysine N-methyltransferase SETD7 [Paratrimastix pyriformis]|uniref:Histone-lysine N-methyltransferase SETD7 n=1 Tax=Paratrimastix pyriformis TaxID=342808 RepID=A0ABQ8USH6_9EUKA|nr:putative histone-lysine N-methyltransferase SETD7 [Paratrimastix pyriformis]